MPRNPDGSAFRPERGKIVDLSTKSAIEFAGQCEDLVLKSAKEVFNTQHEVRLGCLAATLPVIYRACEQDKEEFGEESREYAIALNAKAYLRDLIIQISSELIIGEVN